MSSGEESDSSSFKDDAARTSNQTTWAGRNPSLATQPSRSRTSLTAAEKASRALVQVDRKKRAELLYADVDALLVLRSAQVEELAKKFHEKPEKIEKRLGFQRTKTRRGVTLQNALNHHISKEINADRPVGSKANLQEIIKIRQTDSRYQGLSVSEQQPYLDGLLEDRALKKSGLRISNRSAAQDFRAVVASVSDMIDGMADRTGSYALAFFTRGHVDDQATPEWAASGDSIDFLTEALGLDPWDVTRQFEQWACARSKTQRERETLGTMRAECTKIILSGLTTEFSSQSKNISINYHNYDTSIVQRHSVQIRGWPTDVPFASPSEIGTVNTIRTLRDALKTGSTKWVRMTSREVTAHAAGLKEKARSGEAVGRKRKTRSDKGIRRKGKGKAVLGPESDGDESGGDSEGEGSGLAAPPAQKKRKTKPHATWPMGSAPRAGPSSQVPPRPKSAYRSQSLLSNTDSGSEDSA